MQLDEPLHRLSLPRIPHRALVSIQAVPPAGKREILCRNLIREQGLVKHLAVVQRHHVIVRGMRKKGGRRLRGYLQLIGKEPDQFLAGSRTEKVPL